jgi:hypothetical protein
VTYALLAALAALAILGWRAATWRGQRDTARLETAAANARAVLAEDGAAKKAAAHQDVETRWDRERAALIAENKKLMEALHATLDQPGAAGAAMDSLLSGAGDADGVPTGPALPPGAAPRRPPGRPR